MGKVSSEGCDKVEQREDSNVGHDTGESGETDDLVMGHFQNR